jgi:hypothetical protein
MRCGVSDKATNYILDALARAVAEPAGLPLFGTRTEAGLFPNVSAAKPVAQRCLDQGWLVPVSVDEPTGKGPELYCASEAGSNYLLEKNSPREILEDFVRLLEDRDEDVRLLVLQTQRMAQSLESLRGVVSAMLPQVSSDRLSVPHSSRDASRSSVAMATRTGTLVTVEELAGLLQTRLHDWHGQGKAQDCPLTELYHSLTMLNPVPSVGLFHDALRLLHTRGCVYLHPWTGPLYALPEPHLALLVGHEVAHYASLRPIRSMDLTRGIGSSC